MSRTRAVAAIFAVVSMSLCASAGAAVFEANAGSLGNIPDSPPAPPTCGDYTAAAKDVTVSVSGLTAPVTDVRVGVTFGQGAVPVGAAIGHTWMGDVRMQLISPGGAVTQTVFSQTGAPAGNPTSCGDDSDIHGPYVFSDTAPAAPTWWGAATATGNVAFIPAGSYRASLPGGQAGAGTNINLTPAFAGLTTGQMNGTWTLRFLDGGAGDTGSVTGASLGLNAVTAPQLISDPVTPADNNAPNVKGTAPPESQVALYMTSNCTGAPFATISNTQLAGAGAPIAVADNSSATVSATATDALGAVSPCSAPYTYVEDSVPPATPTLTGTDPASPATSVTPRVKGTSDADTIVKIYPGANCTGAPLAAGSDAQLAGAGLQITVGPATTTQLSAAAVDRAGLSSGCSGAISYTQGAADQDPPETSFKKTPKKKSADDSPTFKALSDEPGSTFQCRADKDAFKACKAKTTFDLKAGKHKVEFAAIDPSGNIDPTPAEFKFKIEG